MRAKIRLQFPVIALCAAALAAVGGPAASAGAIVRPAGQANAAAASPSPARPGLGLVPGLHLGQPARPELPGSPRVPKPGAFSLLNGVYCVSAADCWAVGEYGTSHQGIRNEVLHWNGKTWRTVAVPNPGGHAVSSFSELFGVRCAGVKDCWAVGDYSAHGADLNEALHWNGASWSKVTTPTPAGTMPGSLNELYDVTCLTSSRCWAVGEYGTDGTTGVVRNQVLRWNGRTWSQVRVPEPAGTTSSHINILNAIRCMSATRCLAVGVDGVITGPPTVRNEALLWNGKKWSTLATPQPGGTTATGDLNVLVGLTCASPTSCWAVGTYGTEATPAMLLNEVLHWNGAKWSLFEVPNPDGTVSGSNNELSGDFCSNSRSCWAVGQYSFGHGMVRPLLTEALRWNGIKWSRVKTPNPAGTADQDSNDLFAVRCSRPDNCWAVGQAAGTSGETRNLLLHWNGWAWSVR
jgi:hypothetical protein